MLLEEALGTSVSGHTKHMKTYFPEFVLQATICSRLIQKLKLTKINVLFL